MAWTNDVDEKVKMKQTKSGRKRIVDTTKKYSSSTTIHGISYLSSDNVSKLERLLWISIVLLAIFFTTFQVINLYDEWQAKPVITTLDTVALPIKEIEFPAVTICPQGSREEVMDSVLFRQLKEYIQNKTASGTKLAQNEMMDQVEVFLQDVYPGAKGNPTKLAKLMTSNNPEMYVQNEAIFQLEKECDPDSNVEIVETLNKQLNNDPCPKGFDIVKGLEYCVHKANTEMTYNEASQYCDDLVGSKLFYLDTYEDLTPLKDLTHVSGTLMLLFKYQPKLRKNNLAVNCHFMY